MSVQETSKISTKLIEQEVKRVFYDMHLQNILYVTQYSCNLNCANNHCTEMIIFTLRRDYAQASS